MIKIAKTISIILPLYLMCSCSAVLNESLQDIFDKKLVDVDTSINITPFDSTIVDSVVAELESQTLPGSLALWLDAGNVNITDLESHGQVGTDKVWHYLSAWRDKSGRELHGQYSLDAFAGSETNKPEFVESVSALGGRPAIKLNGSSYFRIVAGLDSTSTTNYIYNDQDETTIYAVLQPDSVSSTRFLFSGGTYDSGYSTYSWPRVYFVGGKFRVFAYYDYYQSDFTVKAGTPFLLTLEKDFTPYQIFKDYLTDNEQYGGSAYAVTSSGEISAKLPIYENDFYSLTDTNAPYYEDEHGLTKMNMLNVKVNDVISYNDFQADNTESGKESIATYATGGGILRTSNPAVTKPVSSSYSMLGKRDIVYCLNFYHYATDDPTDDDYFNTFKFQDGNSKYIKSLYQLNIGQDYTETATGFSGYIAEIMIFNGKLTDEQNTKIVGYLNDKYDL